MQTWPILTAAPWAAWGNASPWQRLPAVLTPALEGMLTLWKGW